MTNDRNIDERLLAELKPHPLQAKMFDDLPAAELRELANDLDKNGLNHEVEITSDGTIICGHQRVRAAKSLGWETIRCWVRDDLVAEGAVEKRLIEDNLNRRHLSKLAAARAYVRMKALTTKSQYGDVRDILGRRLGMSGRNLDRWAKVLATPIEVQNAVDRGEFTLDQAGRISKLSKVEQAAIAKTLSNGTPPREALARFEKKGADKSDHSMSWVDTIGSKLERIKNLTDHRLESRDQTEKAFEDSIATAEQIVDNLFARQVEWQKSHGRITESCEEMKTRRAAG